jgi:hypothetical protein
MLFSLREMEAEPKSLHAKRGEYALLGFLNACVPAPCH